MFTELTRKNGSSRVVCYQYAERLRAAGVEARFFPPSSIRLYEWCCERVQSLRWLAILLKALYWYMVVVPRRLLQTGQAAAFDVVLVQRGLLRYKSPPWLEWILFFWVRGLWGRPLIYALDDAQYLVAESQFFWSRFRMADWIYTGNVEIATHARVFNPNVAIIESAVDVHAVEPRQHGEHWPVVIGWVGTLLDSTGYLSVLRGAMEELARRFPVVFQVVSNRPFDAGGAAWLRNEKWTLEREWNNLVAFDIGVMPLPDDEFTRAKEGYKLKQYMAAGLPIVCSPVGQNQKLVQDGVNGFFASTEREWVEKLALLVSDWRLRARMGRAGRQFVAERYALEVVTPRLAAFFRQVCHKGRSGSEEQCRPSARPKIFGA